LAAGFAALWIAALAGAAWGQDQMAEEEQGPEGDQALTTEMTFAPPILAGGDPRGVYYAVATSIDDLIDAPVEVMVTTGSMENLVRLQVDDVQLAIAQSDRVAQALIGLPPFDGERPFSGLRALVALYPEPINILVRADSGIGAIADLAERRVNFGTRDDLTGRLLAQVIDAHNLPDTEIEATAVPIGEQGDFLCAGEVDAIALIAGHPSGSLYRIAEACPVRALAIDGGAAQTLLADIPALAPATIPGGLYPGIDEPVSTLGPMAVLVSEDGADSGLVRSVVTGLIENLGTFRDSHPALTDLTLERMRGPGLGAPLHDQAAAAFNALAPME
jgi:hypothetical protein